MIISRTPVRVSFCGGGTDVDWFSQSSENGGMVTSLALDRYIHVTVNKRFDDRIRVSYSKLEIVDNFEDIEHELVRESMRMTGVTSGVEITTIADIPSRGTGLGSSSSVTVGLLNALHCFAGRSVSASQLASEACQIEINILEQPIGRQDQYAASFGGFNFIEFYKNDRVIVNPLNLKHWIINELESSIILYYTGKSRVSADIISEQNKNTSSVHKSPLESMHKIKLLSKKTKEALITGEISSLANILKDSWFHKKNTSSKISNKKIDEIYNKAMHSGALAGKISGAGGGGFMFFLVDPINRSKVTNKLNSLGGKVYNFQFVKDGMKGWYISK